ncbi:MAG: tripartite tricarboxylate transporter TctB family protein [Spirochaetes bacterium]|nr:tripartite tricarboxylate transporter TctB family protein [Spirochaetota bacterium]
MKKANIVSGLVGMAFSAVVFIRTLGFREFPNIHMGPEAFPRLMAGGLFVCSLILALQALLAKPAAGAQAEESPTLSPLNKGMQRLFVGIAIIVLYAVGWQPVGFLVVTPLAMFAIMLLVGFRKYLKMAVFSVLMPLIIFYAFSFFLNVNMPLGILSGILW